MQLLISRHGIAITETSQQKNNNNNIQHLHFVQPVLF